MPIKIPDNLKPILNLQEEDDKALQDLAVKHNAVLIALIAPYIPERISPSQFISASLGLSEEFGVETLIGHIQKATKCKKLYLLINSLGGNVPSSYKIARAIRRYFQDITVFVPHIAASGGTLIALSGNRIVMSLMSHLTPIDPQLRTSDGGYITINSLPKAFSRLVDYFEKKEKDEAPYPWVCMTEKIDPIQYETYTGEVKTLTHYAEEILRLANPKLDPKKATHIARTLTEKFDSHGTVIGLDLAKLIELPAVGNEGYKQEWELMRTWLGKYFLKSEGIHFIRFVLPIKKNENRNTSKGKKK